MIYQDDRRLDRNLNKYGCYFMCLVYYREKYLALPATASWVEETWLEAIRVGAITSDLNHDGDLDDDGEAIIQNPDALCALLGLPLKYRDGHFPLTEPVPPDAFVITAWNNPRTGFTHFVVGNKKPVEFDPIAGGSITVRDGAPRSLRIYEKAE